MGFRKIDTDKWEFLNEGFVRGKKHLLKKIQRRKSHHQPHQLKSSSSGPSKDAALEGEIENLRKERRLMMHKVLELQHNQHDTIQHMEVVKEKLEAAENTQKQMVSFLAKMLEKPESLAHLQHNREKNCITSPKSARKYVKHEPLQQDDEMDMAHQLLHTPEDGILGSVDSSLEGKAVMGPQVISFPEDLVMETSIGEDVWSMGLEGGDGNCSNYNVLSDVWDVGVGDVGVERWLDENDSRGFS